MFPYSDHELIGDEWIVRSRYRHEHKSSSPYTTAAVCSNPVSASLFSLFNCCIKSYMHHKCIYTKFLYMYFVTNALPYTFLILLCSGEIEINPGPEPSYWENLSVCHWTSIA